MGKILITGASGFLGAALVEQLRRSYDLIAIGRHKPTADIPFVSGLFYEFEDLRQLDPTPIEAVIHLGAVTGGCSDRDGIRVNVEGTGCLMRYLIDRGCRKFVLASSIAAVGLQSIKFRPQHLPIREDHPCLDRDGYGLSKYLMEKVSEYYQRRHEEIDVLNLRLAAIYDPQNPPNKIAPGTLGPWAIASATFLARDQAIRALRCAYESQYKPGVRTMNIVHPQAWVSQPVPDILSSWYPDLDVDLSFYRQPGNEKAGLFDPTRAQQELGFCAATVR